MTFWTGKTNNDERAPNPEELDAHIRQYVDSLPPLDDDPEFDERIIRGAVDHRIGILEKKHEPLAPPSSTTVAERLRAFMASVPKAQSPKLAWAIGFATALVVIATSIIILQSRLETARTQLASEAHRNSSSERSRTPGKETRGEGTNGVSSQPGTVDPQALKQSRDDASSHLRTGKHMRFASIPVVFSMRGSDSEQSGTVSENMSTALQIIARTLDRNGIAFTTESSGNIVTNIMVWDAGVVAQEKVPLRFVADISSRSVVITPASLIPETSSKEAATLKVLYREIKIEIEDELRYR